MAKVGEDIDGILMSLLLVTVISLKYEIRVASDGPDHGDCHRVRAWQIHGGLNPGINASVDAGVDARPVVIARSWRFN